MKKAIITNKTEAPIEINGVELQVGINNIFDIDIKSEYNNAFKLLSNIDNVIIKCIDEEVIDVEVDDVLFTSREHFYSLWDGLKKIVEKAEVGFCIKHDIFYDLADDKMKVKNPLTGKIYSVQLTEETE